MKNNSVKNAAVALAIALPLLTIGLLVKANEPAGLSNAPSTASGQASRVASNDTTITVAKTTARAAERTVADSKSETSITMDKRTQSCYSSTSFLLLVDLTAQRVEICDGEKGEWQQVKGYTCSSGALGSQTPTGKFRIQNRGTWF